MINHQDYTFFQSIQLWTNDINTILFGGGVKSYPFLHTKTSLVYTHNVFLEILSELGIVGLIIFLKIIFIFYKNKSNNELLNAFSIFAIIIFCVTGNYDTFYQYISFYA